MKTLWAVSNGSYSDYRVLALFEDEETANAWRDAMNAEEEPYYRDVRVEQFQLLSRGDVPYKVTTWTKIADLFDSGEIKNENEWSTVEWAIERNPPFPLVRPRVRYVRAPCHGNRGGRLEVHGASEKVVAQTFSEKVRMWRVGAFGGPGANEIEEIIEEADQLKDNRQ